MSVRLIRAAEQDDAAFRARLAPLASEVLPGPHMRAAPSRASWLSRRIIVILCGFLSGIVLAGSAWLIAERMRPVAVTPSTAPAAAPTITAAPVPTTPPPAPANTIIATPLPPATAPANTSIATPLPAPNEMISLLLRRGDAALADGDIIAARLLFEQAATLGSPAAATAAGKTYDAEFLAQSGALGIRPDQAAAAAWFRKAAALGDEEARTRLARIEGRPRP
jgi:hypothetical protein